MINGFTENTGEATVETVVMWHGTLSSIPAGWVLCDGNNGTPDLRDKFIKGSPSYTNGAGASGGQHSVSLSTAQMASHNHSASNVSTEGNHNHTFGSGTTYDEHTFSVHGESGSTSNTYSLPSAGSHSHSADSSATGSGNSIDNRPHHYEVVFIYKV